MVLIGTEADKQNSPDHLRMNPNMVRFVREFVISGKTVAAVYHAPWMLVEHRASAASSARSSGGR